MHPTTALSKPVSAPSSAPVKPLQWRVTTNRFRHLGIYKGDQLILDANSPADEGDWLVLQFNSKYYLRQLGIHEDHWQLSPLEGVQQPIAWPKHQTLPLVGKVTAVHRELRQSCSVGDYSESGIAG